MVERAIWMKLIDRDELKLNKDEGNGVPYAVKDKLHTKETICWQR